MKTFPDHYSAARLEFDNKNISKYTAQYAGILKPKKLHFWQILLIWRDNGQY